MDVFIWMVIRDLEKRMFWYNNSLHSAHSETVSSWVKIRCFNRLEPVFVDSAKTEFQCLMDHIKRKQPLESANCSVPRQPINKDTLSKFACSNISGGIHIVNLIWIFYGKFQSNNNRDDDHSLKATGKNYRLTWEEGGGWLIYFINDLFCEKENIKLAECVS